MFKKITVLGICALFAINIYAVEDPYGPVLPLVWSSIITLSGGPAWSIISGQNQRFLPFPPPALIFNRYIARSQSNILGTGELFFGLQNFIGASSVIGQFGIGVAGAGEASVSGTVNVNGIPNVYSYRYNVSHWRPELKGKLIANGFRLVQPYISASIGAGFNFSSNYTVTTIDPILFPIYKFGSATHVAISYTLGLGIQKMLSPNWQVGVGYEFADWGENNLGQARGTLITTGPRMSHLYTNELLFSISYMY